MPRPIRILLSFVALALLVGGAVILGNTARTETPPDSVVCTADAMQCPDGSYVGRTGPKCEFVCPTATSTPTPKVVRVEAGVGLSGKTNDVEIKPLEVLEDSRCPIGVECVWAGTVRVKTEIKSGMGVSTMTLTLGTSITTEAEKITLISVLPAPKAGTTIVPALYKFIFEVEKR